jgi:hypothetical protein
MKLQLVLFAGFTLFPSAVDAAVSRSSIVECSSISEGTASFDACATWYEETPAPTTISGNTVWVGDFKNEYTIVQGMKEGADTNSLTDSAKKDVFSSGIMVSVKRDAFFECWVTVEVKGKSTMCSSCYYCGEETYSADCTNVKDGRSTTCESTDTGAVFFPLTSAALKATKAPAGKPVSTPVAAPVRKVVPTQKPIAPVPAPKPLPKPVRAPTGAPKQVKAPTSAPKQVKAPTGAPKQLRAPTAAPKRFVVPEVAPITIKAPVQAPKQGSVPVPRLRVPITKLPPVQKAAVVKPKPPVRT